MAKKIVIIGANFSVNNIGGSSATVVESLTDDNLFKMTTGSSLTRTYLYMDFADTDTWALSVSVASDSTIKVGIQFRSETGDTLVAAGSKDSSNPALTKGTAVVDSGWIVAGASKSYSQDNLDIESKGISAIGLAITYIDGSTGMPTLAEIQQYLTIEKTNINVLS